METAARDLFAGQLLTHSMITAATVPDATHALVGLQLKAEQVPSAGLDDGDPVALVGQPPVVSGTSRRDPTGASDLRACGRRCTVNGCRPRW